MIINTKINAQPGQVFVPGCFDENLGETIDVMITGSERVGQGKITNISVAHDGTHAWFTLDVPDVASDTPDIGPVLIAAQEGPGYTGYAEEGI